MVLGFSAGYARDLILVLVAFGSKLKTFIFDTDSTSSAIISDKAFKPALETEYAPQKAFPFLPTLEVVNIILGFEDSLSIGIKFFAMRKILVKFIFKIFSQVAKS